MPSAQASVCASDSLPDSVAQASVAARVSGERRLRQSRRSKASDLTAVSRASSVLLLSLPQELNLEDMWLNRKPYVRKERTGPNFDPYEYDTDEAAEAAEADELEFVEFDDDELAYSSDAEGAGDAAAEDAELVDMTASEKRQADALAAAWFEHLKSRDRDAGGADGAASSKSSGTKASSSSRRREDSRRSSAHDDIT